MVWTLQPKFRAYERPKATWPENIYRFVPHPLHLLKSGGGDNGSRSFFYDLLVAALDGTVSAEQRDSVPVLVGQDLYLQVARMFS